MKLRLLIFLLALCAYGGFVNTLSIEYLHVGAEHLLKQQKLMLMLSGASAIAGAVGTYAGLVKFWQFQASRYVRTVGFSLIVLFATPSLLLTMSAAYTATTLHGALVGIAKGETRYQTVLVRFLNQSQSAPDPKIRAQAAKKMFEIYAVHGTWMDENDQLQVYLPTPEELERVKAIKMQYEKELNELFEAKPVHTLNTLVASLFVTLLSYVGTLLVLLFRRVIRA